MKEENGVCKAWTQIIWFIIHIYIDYTIKVKTSISVILNVLYPALLIIWKLTGFNQCSSMLNPILFSLHNRLSEFRIFLIKCAQ